MSAQDLTDEEVRRFQETARQARIDILKMLNEAGSGHPGGSLSLVEIMTVLFGKVLRYDPRNPGWPDRDKLIFSKGHAAPVLYSFLCRAGYFPPEHLSSLRKLDGILQGHVDCLTTPGVETSTGSLGQGLSQANGVALADRLDRRGSRVYAVLGDGEVQEGQIWEAAMTAAHYELDNVCAVLDRNRLQIDGPVEEVKSIEPLRDKWEAFGWHVIEIDGHDFHQILEALQKAGEIKGKPTVIIAHTVKGKGVSFMENKVEYHGVAPTDDELERALEELGVT